jgi:acylphosphatase
MSRMKAMHLLITGRVQGVGFRDWLRGKATQLNLAGWVRNVGHDTVEALIAGETSAVDECLRACRVGPPTAVVDKIVSKIADPPPEPGFFKHASLAKRP